MARPTVKFDDKERAEISELASLGLTCKEIAQVKGCSETTLIKHCQEDMARGRAGAHIRVKKRALEMAESGENTAMTIFYLKTQCRWREKDRDDDKLPGDEGPLKLGTKDPLEAAKIYQKLMSEDLKP